MATTREDIERWFINPYKDTPTHMLVVCDTFDWEDYPVYVTNDQNVSEVIASHSRDMQRVMEVYNYSIDLNTQLNEHRSYHL